MRVPKKIIAHKYMQHLKKCFKFSSISVKSTIFGGILCKHRDNSTTQKGINYQFTEKKQSKNTSLENQYILRYARNLKRENRAAKGHPRSVQHHYIIIKSLAAAERAPKWNMDRVCFCQLFVIAQPPPPSSAAGRSRSCDVTVAGSARCTGPRGIK